MVVSKGFKVNTAGTVTVVLEAVVPPALWDAAVVPRRLPDLGILARITRDELVSITDALGLDADTIGTLTIRPDSIYLTGFDPATNRPTDRLIQIGEFPEPEDLPSPGPGWHVVPGCKCGHPMAHHLDALGCTWRIGRDRCRCWTYEAREAGA